MSNDKKKALLNEATTKRFWKLAGLRPIHEKAYMFEEDEDLEEGMDRKKEDDDLEEGMNRKKEDDDIEEGMGRKKEDEDLEEGMNRAKEDEEGIGHGGKSFPAKTKKKDKGHAGQPQRNLKEEELGEMGMGMPAAAEDDMGGEEPMPEEPGMEDEGPEDGQDVEVDVPEGDVASLKTARDILDQILSAVDGGEEPEMDAEPEMGDDEEEPALQEVDQEELEEVAERIANRVAKRISESLIRNKN
jgi:hypothetical protein